jgi:hypothetical protein
MQHTELVLIPLFVVSDYLLTLAGGRRYCDTHEARVASERNPRFRDIVAPLCPMPAGFMLRCAATAPAASAI